MRTDEWKSYQVYIDGKPAPFLEPKLKAGLVASVIFGILALAGLALAYFL